MADTPTPEANLEPVITGYVISLITGVGAAIGYDLSDELVGKIATAAVGLIVVVVSAWWSRNKVTPVAKVDAVVTAAVEAAQPTTVAVANATFDLTGNTAAQQVMADLAGGETVALTSLTPAPDPLPPVPTIRPFATGLVVEPDDAGVDH